MAGKRHQDQSARRARVIGLLRRLAADESGATAIEYGLIAGLIALVLVTSFSLLGNSLGGRWNMVSDTVVPALAH